MTCETATTDVPLMVVIVGASLIGFTVTLKVREVETLSATVFGAETVAPMAWACNGVKLTARVTVNVLPAMELTVISSLSMKMLNPGAAGKRVGSEMTTEVLSKDAVGAFTSVSIPKRASAPPSVTVTVIDADPKRLAPGTKVNVPFDGGIVGGVCDGCRFDGL